MNTNSGKTTSPHAAADYVLTHCGNLKPREAVVVVCDDRTADIAALFAERVRFLGADATLHRVPAAPMHGTEPPSVVAQAMAGGDLIVGLTTMSMAHTRARGEACRNGARYLSMPDYSWALLTDACVLTDYRARAPLVRRIADLFTAGRRVHVTGPAGTDIRLNITGRRGNYCPGFVDAPGDLGSPPDIEANVSPIETDSEGEVVVDGSIPCREIGLLSSPVRLLVERGRIVRIDGDPAVVTLLTRLFDDVGDDRSKVLAECGVGLNPDALLQGLMLTDEGAFGCLHFGFGANSTVGGTNEVPFHLDFVFRAGNLTVDGQPVFEKGQLIP